MHLWGRMAPLPPLSLREAPHPLGCCSPVGAHFKAGVSCWWSSSSSATFHLGRCCLQRQPHWFRLYSLAAALHSSQIWMCVLFDSTEPAAGQPPWGRYPGQLSVTSASLWDCREPEANQWLNLRSSPLQIPSLQGGGFSFWGSHFSESLTRTWSWSPALPCGTLADLMSCCCPRKSRRRDIGSWMRQCLVWLPLSSLLPFKTRKGQSVSYIIFYSCLAILYIKTVWSARQSYPLVC